MEMIKLEYCANKESFAGMKNIFALLIAFLILISACACGETDANLILNGDFSNVDANGMPVGWSREMWFTDTGVSRLYVDENGYDGNCVAVVNADPNDARFAQTIAVEPDSIYRFSCMVRAEGCSEDGYGATISFEDTFSYSDSIWDTSGDWQEICVYGRTGADQDEVKLFIRLGGYGNLGKGRAWFDNIEAVKLDAAPEGVEALSLEAQKSSGGKAASADPAEDTGAPARNTEAFLLLAFLYGVLLIAIARRMGRLDRSRMNARALMAIGLSAAFLLRVILSVAVRGYNTDINCFSAWSERIFANDPAHFYAEDYFCDYPPGYMLLLWIPAALRSLLGLPLQGGVHLFLLKLTPILCDLLGAWLIWRTARRHGVSDRIAAVLAMLYAFNPAVFIDSAAWGQIDSVFTLLIALCALQAAEEKYIPSLLAFAAAMLIKPQAMLFAPLGLAAILIFLLRRRNGRKTLEFILGVIAALALIYAAAFLFYIGRAQSAADAILGPIPWMIELYGGTMGSYGYLTINALNLYALLGFNWTATASQPLWTIFAWALFALSYALCILICAKSKKNRHLLLSGGLLIALIYTFGPMIHERYIFPALLLLALAYAMDRDRRLLVSLSLFGITAAMNELLVLQGGMGAANYGHLQSSEQWLNALLALVNVGNAFYLAWVALDICIAGHVVHLKPEDPEALPPAEKYDHRLHLRGRDYLLMAAVTLIYAAIAFANLGVTQAPQTSWISSQSGENIVFDLGEERDFRMIYYGGICNSTFTVELSNDGEAWTAAYRAQYDQGEIFRWIDYVPHDESGNIIYNSDDNGTRFASAAEAHPMQHARYVRITALSAGLTLSEVGFWGADGALIEVQNIVRAGEFIDNAGDPACLIDEQGCVAETPSYLNGTYFDEIYHARTAYEHLHGLSTYEWTHPPLGKVLMMIGIQIFGMTPFGWRFMGALIGVLMLPLMYLLAKQITKSTRLSAIAMCLLALDSMHFTQTRIATIDSYAVFWIMLMYLFMIRYIQMDWRKVSIGRSLIPLGLCGITMGVAIATKWIGAYAAVGLAILLFWKLIRDLIYAGADRRACLKRCLWVILFCMVFFVAIPLLIYYFSYFWQLRSEGVSRFADMFSSRWIKRVVQLQESMLSYHAGLGGDTHYFRSEWYEWPVIWWPMWYYSGSAYMPEGMVSSISCMGNPAVWWSGLIALIALLLMCAWSRRARRSWLIVLIGFASQFLPWVLVPRSTFIYHYFASVPFIILCTALALGRIRRKNPAAYQWSASLLLMLALILFAAFYPLESGLPVAKSYAKYLRWFKWYNY